MKRKSRLLRNSVMMAIIFTIMVSLMPVKVFADEALQIGIDGYKAEDGKLKIYVNQNRGNEFNVTPDQTQVMFGNNEMVTSEIRTFGEVAEPVTYLCVVDVSGSMSQDRIDKAKEIIGNLADKKKPEDKMAITTMGNELNQSGYMTDPEEIKNLAGAISVTREDTNLYYAIVEEINELKVSDEAKGKKCLLIFSDGADDQATGITQGEAETAVTSSHIPVFTVGLLKNANSGKDQDMAKTLGSFARISSGGLHFAPALGDGEIDTIADSIIDKVNSSLVFYEGLENVDVSGKEVVLKVTVSDQNDQSATDTINIPESDIKLIQQEIPQEPEVIPFQISISEYRAEAGELIVYVVHNREGSIAESLEGESVTLDGTELSTNEVQRTQDGQEKIILHESLKGFKFQGKEADLTVTFKADGETASDTKHLSEEDVKLIKKNAGGLILGLEPMYFYAICGLLAVLLAVLVLLIVKNSKKQEPVPEEEPAPEDAPEEESYEEDNSYQPGPSYSNENVTIPGEALGGQSVSMTMPITSQARPESGSGTLNVLFVRMGKGEEKTFKAAVGAGPCNVGRNATQSKMAMTDDTALSSVHCSLMRKGNRLFIKDEKSTNGTFVNGVPISGQFELSQDDIVLIGSYEYRVSWK